MPDLIRTDGRIDHYASGVSYCNDCHTRLVLMDDDVHICHNWDTNEVMLWLANDEGLYLWAKDIRRSPTLAGDLRDLDWETINESIDVDDVDWIAVANFVLEEL